MSKIIVEIEQGDIPLPCDELCWLVARIDNIVEEYCNFESIIDKPIKVSVKNKTLRIGSEFDNKTKQWNRCCYE